MVAMANTIQKGFMKGHDYLAVRQWRTRNDVYSTRKNGAEKVRVNGLNLRSYGSKVKPWIGTWDRKENNYGRDLNALIYGSDYDSNSGSNLLTILVWRGIILMKTY